MALLSAPRPARARRPLTVAIAIAIPAAFACGGRPADEIVVLHTGDTYGYFDTCGCRSDSTGGLAKRAWVIDSLRRSTDAPILVFDTGDFSGGENEAGAAMGRTMAEAMQLMAYDAVTFGEWDLNHGPTFLRSILETTDTPWVHTNYDVVGLEDLGHRTLVVERGGRRIGVIGLYNPTILLTGGMRDSVVVEDIVESANRAVGELRRQNVDLVVALSHLSYKGSRALPEYVPGIDLILTGHGGKSLTAPEKLTPETWVAAAGDLGRWIARSRVELGGEPVSVEAVEGDLIVMVPSLPNDPRLDPLFARYEERRQEIVQREMQRAAAARDAAQPRTSDRPPTESR
ncbi:MAG TPA: metallophosphoesterase [Gemmatimonadota bacterium]|nr:metallophosphoesterase [Gemmatimonadota bacterium]